MVHYQNSQAHHNEKLCDSRFLPTFLRLGSAAADAQALLDYFGDRGSRWCSDSSATIMTASRLARACSIDTPNPEYRQLLEERRPARRSRSPDGGFLIT